MGSVSALPTFAGRYGDCTWGEWERPRLVGTSAILAVSRLPQRYLGVVQGNTLRVSGMYRECFGEDVRQSLVGWFIGAETGS